MIFEGNAKCYKCRLTLAKSLFYKDNSRGSGCSNRCKSCQKEYQWLHPEKYSHSIRYVKFLKLPLEHQKAFNERKYVLRSLRHNTYERYNKEKQKINRKKDPLYYREYGIQYRIKKSLNVV